MKFLISLCLSLLFFLPMSRAQEAARFTDRLWYGGNFNLGFSGNGVYNIFNLGLAPMVGYKILPPLSAGPRLSFNYFYIRGLGTDGNIHNVHPVAFSAGVFTRVRIIPFLFAHAEYEYENFASPLFSGAYLFYDNSLGKVPTVRSARDNAYLGLGYNSAGGQGGFGYEILLLYNVLAPSNTIALPISLRFGMTYNY